MKLKITVVHCTRYKFRLTLARAKQLLTQLYGAYKYVSRIIGDLPSQLRQDII